jgi:hypothetical protein
MLTLLFIFLTITIKKLTRPGFGWQEDVLVGTKTMLFVSALNDDFPPVYISIAFTG